MASRPGGFLNGSQSAMWDAPVRRFKVHKPDERAAPNQSTSMIDTRPSDFLNSSQSEAFAKPGHTSYSSMNNSASRMNGSQYSSGSPRKETSKPYSLRMSPESSPASSPLPKAKKSNIDTFRPGGFLNGSQSAMWDAPVKRFQVHKPNERSTPSRTQSMVDTKPSGFLNTSQGDIWSKPGHTSYTNANNSTTSCSSMDNSASSVESTVLKKLEPVKTVASSPESSPEPSKPVKTVATRPESSPEPSPTQIGRKTKPAPVRTTSIRSIDSAESSNTRDSRKKEIKPRKLKSSLKRTDNVQSLLTGGNTENYADIRGCLKNVAPKQKETMASKVKQIALKAVEKETVKEVAKVEKAPVVVKKVKTKPAANRLPARKGEIDATIKIQSIVRMKFARTQWDFRMLRQRLKGMGGQTKLDLERINADVVKKKKTLKEKAKKKMEARAKQGDQVQDKQKLVAYLKEDNSSIRARNAKLEVNMRNLQTNNMRLKKNNDAGGDYHKRLSMHHEKVVFDNTKLTKNLDDVKKKVEEIEDELIEKSKSSALEHSIRCQYQETIDKLVKRIMKTKHKDLRKEVCRLVSVLDMAKTGWPTLSPKKHKAAFEVDRFELPSDEEGECIDKPPFGNSSSNLLSNISSSSESETSDSSVERGINRKPQKTAQNKSIRSTPAISKKKTKTKLERGRTGFGAYSSSSDSDSSAEAKPRPKKPKRKVPKKKIRKVQNAARKATPVQRVTRGRDDDSVSSSSISSS